MERDSPADPHLEADLLEADPFYIRTASPLADAPSLVLKEGDSFGVFDRRGDIRPIRFSEEGLYHHGTRYLCSLGVRLGRRRPLLLGAAARTDNAGIAIDLTNPDLMEADAIAVPRGTLHLSRLLVLSEGVLHDRLRVRNYGPAPVHVSIDLEFDADFVDLFEVRGTSRARRGDRLPSIVNGREVTLAYRGLDSIVRYTRILIEAPSARLFSKHAVIDCPLDPDGEQEIFVMVRCEGVSHPPAVSFAVALQTVTEDLRRRREGFCEIQTSNHHFNAWLRRSLADLSMMVTDTSHGEYPYAGVPWYSCPFGRDGIITALECLWVNPGVARGVLQFLAATQASTLDSERDAQPGKILHEMRSGEMAALGEIPFGRYYGSHDATPLFVMLAAAYFERTDDRSFVEALWPAIEAALGWIDRDGDLDGDGFVEYARLTSAGLIHQGWKDSHDAVFHANGELAVGPIALCEIQAYVFAAWRGASTILAALGDGKRAMDYASRADRLRRKFEAAFWCESLGTYAFALDGQKRPCVVRASNAGHALFAGIAGKERAAIVTRTLMAPEAYSGWGIRTVSTQGARYNPMSYHNGSIWPHDNAIVAAGFARYGFHAEALTVLSGLFDAALHLDHYRLPELFCGFARARDEGPVSYPVACTPQAWATASVYLLLQGALGLEIRAADRTVTFTRSALPEFLPEVRIRGLEVGPHKVDLLLERHEHDVGITVLNRTGSVAIVAIK